MLPFALGPLFVSLAVAIEWRSSTRAQLTLAFSSFLFTIWFFTVFMDVFYWHPDPQSPIALLVVGIYSLPFMFIAWLVAWRLWRRDHPKCTSP